MTYSKEVFGLCDRDGWPSGPWDDEPDKVEWEDKESGLACLILRTPAVGILCGYVGVPEGHPWHRLCISAVEACDVDVHGGLTFDGGWRDDLDPDRAPSAEGLWWFGFDCGHFHDMFPLTASRAGGGVYRDIGFVKAECARLAEQAARAAEAGAEA